MCERSGLPHDALDASLETWERKGRLLAQAIVLVNAALIVARFVSALLVRSANATLFLAMLFWLFVLAMLYKGRPWAKWLFVIAAAVNAVGMVSLLPSLAGLPPASVRVVLALAIQVVGVAGAVIGALLLLFSGALNDHLDGRRRLEDARAAAEIAQQGTRKRLSD